MVEPKEIIRYMMHITGVSAAQQEQLLEGDISDEVQTAFMKAIHGDLVRLATGMLMAEKKATSEETDGA